MNMKALAKQYGNLTPEECFRLMLAASGRGDEAERERLTRAGGRISLSMQDHAPYARALDEVGDMLYLDLLEEVAKYEEAWRWADDAEDDLSFGGKADEADENDEASQEPDAQPAGEEPDAKADAGAGESDDEQPTWLRWHEVAMAAASRCAPRPKVGSGFASAGPSRPFCSGSCYPASTACSAPWSWRSELRSLPRVWRAGLAGFGRRASPRRRKPKCCACGAPK